MTAYHSIFQKRARPVTCTDFEQAAPLQIFSEYFRSDRVEQDVEKWNIHIPSLPQDIQCIFRENFDSNFKLNIVFDGTENPEFVNFNITNLLDQYFAGAIFYDGLDQTPESQIEIEEESFRGQGLGKKWFRFLNELCLAFGHERLEFSAGLTNGGYTWARAGAHIDLSPTKHTALTQLREKIALRVEAVKPYIPNDVYHSVRTLGRVVAKDDVTRIADIDFRLSPKACSQMEAWDGPFLDSLSAAFNHQGIDEQNKEQRHAEHCVMAARVQGVPLNIGRYLLVGTVWDAVVDFSDVQQMERIGKYVGGWKTIQPTDAFNPPSRPNRSQPSPVSW